MITPFDMPPPEARPLDAFAAELRRPVMRGLLWALWIEIGAFGGALAIIKAGWL